MTVVCDHERRNDRGGTEYDEGTTSSTKRTNRMGEKHDASAEAPRQRERENPEGRRNQTD